MITTHTPTITHRREDCTPERLETIHHETGVTVNRCLDCGQQIAFNPDGSFRPEPRIVGPLAGLIENRDDDLMRPTTTEEI